MSILRFFPMAVLRNQRIAMLLLLLILLLLVFRLQRNDSPVVILFEDSVAYCNAPEKRVLDNGSYRFTEFKLMQVQVLIRHGDRAPIELTALPNTAPVRIPCLFNATKYLHMKQVYKINEMAKRNVFHVKGSKKGAILDQRVTCAGGQLTPYGYVQHLILGEAFRKMYKSILTDVDIVGDIHVQSTDHHRTIQSAVSFLTGAFYDELVEKTPKVVINVHRDRVAHGHMLLDEKGKDLACPVLHEDTKKLRESRSVKFFLSNVEPMINKMASMLLVPRNAMPPYNRLVDILFAKLCHGQGVPLGPNYRLPQSMVRQALQFSHVYVNVHHTGLAELQTLSILSQIALRYLDLIRNSQGVKKFVLYSGHDTTVAPFLQLLNLWDGKWPPYAANVIVEFYESNDNTDVSVKGRIKSSYFRIVYNGVALAHMFHKSFCSTLLKDGELCPVRDLFRYVSNNVFDESIANMDQDTFDELLFKRIKTLCTKK